MGAAHRAGIVNTDTTVDPDDNSPGCLILVRNHHGLMVAFGPYGEMEAHEIAVFAEHISTHVYFVSLYEGDELHISRYGPEVDSGELPSRRPLHPTQPDEVERVIKANQAKHAAAKAAAAVAS